MMHFGLTSVHIQGHGVGLGARPHKGKYLPPKGRIPEDSVQGMPLDHNGHHHHHDVEAGRPVTHINYVDHEAHQADIDAGRPVTH